MSKLITLSLLAKFKTNMTTWVTNLLNGYVAKVDGKGLSTNDLTGELKNQYGAAYTHSQNGDVHVTAAQKTAWDGKANADHTHTGYAAASHGHSFNDLTNKPTIPTTVAQLTDAADYAKKSDISTAYKFKGSVANEAALPTTADVGDVYNTEDTGMNYAWDGEKWDALGTTLTIETATEAEIDALFA